MPLGRLAPFVVLTVAGAILAADEPAAWTDAGFDPREVALAGMVVHARSRAATLACDNGRLIEHSDPARWDVIGNLVELDGRLLASASFDFSEGRMLSPWAYSEGAQVLEYDPVADRWTVLKDLEQSMIFNLRVVDGRLLIAEYFPWTADRITAYDGAAWSELAKLPGPMLHGLDVCGYQGKLYWSGAWRAGTVEESMRDPNWYGGYGRVYESADQGKTWREVYADKENGRMSDMVVMKDRLYCNRRGQMLMRWDGATWTEVPVAIQTRKGDKAALGTGLLTVFKDAILAASAPICYRYDGATWTSCVPGFLRISVDGGTAYGLREDGHVYASTDGKAWKVVTKTGVPLAEYARQARFGKTLRRGAVAMHAGRLHVGTGATGKLFAGAYAAAGTLVSAPRSTTGGTRLSWTGELPAGTGATFTVRTAATRGALSSAAWGAPLVTSPAAVTLPRGHAWMQYRVQLTSEGARTPAVRTVAWGP